MTMLSFRICLYRNSTRPQLISLCCCCLQLNHNVKNVVLGGMHPHRRLMVTLKDSSVVTLDKIPVAVAQKMKEYLEKLKQGKPTGNDICDSDRIMLEMDCCRVDYLACTLS